MKSSDDRYWGKVDKSGGPDACWLWAAGKDTHGYGKVWRDCRHTLAHRVAFELTYGPIPDGLHCLHRCDVRACVNPGHLWLGSNADNVADKTAKGRGNSPRGERHGSRTKPESRPRGEQHGCTKLTADKVRAIRAATGTQAEIATQFAVSQTQVSRIRRGKNWTRV